MRLLRTLLYIGWLGGNSIKFYSLIDMGAFEGVRRGRSTTLPLKHWPMFFFGSFYALID
jgi:hypothetical protein